jgi:hypothetical protein
MKLKCVLSAVLVTAIAVPVCAQGFDAARARQVLDVIGRADSNRDGKTTLVEFRVARTAQFNKLAGKDGNLNLAAIAKTADSRTRLLGELDANTDGKISRAEYVNNKPRLWSRVDRDGDGAISAAELKTAKARVAAMG